MTISRVVVAAASLALGALALAGCAGQGPAGSGGTDATSGAEIEVEAGWLDGGRAIALVTQGSSTCVPTASEVALQADGTVAVTLEDPAGDAVCTRDLVPRATLVELPAGADPGAELAVVVTYGDARGETDLDAYTGDPVEEYAPSAGWVDDGQFAVLTWGSSSCAPVVESVEATSSSEVLVTFVTPPADQACTMDMAPRVVLATVEGVEDDAATLTLIGGGPEFADGVTIPISR